MLINILSFGTYSCSTNHSVNDIFSVRKSASIFKTHKTETISNPGKDRSLTIY